MTRFAQTKARFSFARIIGVFCAALVACVLALGIQAATRKKPLLMRVNRTRIRSRSMPVTVRSTEQLQRAMALMVMANLVLLPGRR